VAPVSILFGVLLILLGIGGYVLPEVQSPTALIPAVLGIILVGLGVLSRQDRYRKHAMHAAAALALIGLLVALGHLIPGAIKNGYDLSNEAQLAVSLMALLCAVFVGLCVRSFILARRNRERTPTP
jgi:hypothetical protein